jgi:hypothetical protein
MILSDRLYKILKWVAIAVIPALVTFWSAIATVWSLPYGTEIATTIGAVGVLLAALLGISNGAYMRARKADEPKIGGTDE